MGVDLSVLYDKRSESLSTGIRAVYLLFLQDKWDLLESVGVTQELLPKFKIFSEKMITNPGKGGRIRTERDTEALVRFIPQVLDAAIRLTGEYQVLMKEVRKAA